MSLDQLNFQRIRCDRCGTSGPEGYTANEVRGKAYVEGLALPVTPPREREVGRWV